MATTTTEVSPTLPPGVELRAPWASEFACILSRDALEFVASLHRRFDQRRLELLQKRRRRQQELDDGALPDFLSETAAIRGRDWRVAPVHKDLEDRRLEITGPVDRKMIINALNSAAKTFMADFEDSCSPTWHNVVQGQLNLRDAVSRTISYTHPVTGKRYALNERTATLLVRPRGWHLVEKHVLVDSKPVSGAIFDFALFMFHNIEALRRRGTGPYFYLPKLESHLEARLWNDVFVVAQDSLDVPRGTIKATVLIETILAAFEMDEILYELREHSAGLNCGRWDYIFSFIKKFRNRAEFLLPDRSQVTMSRRFLKSYVDLLIQTCHRRGAHAMGGMAAQIPIRDDPERNRQALARVHEDKLREAKAGHDGTWIAHPGLAATALEPFDRVMTGPNQLAISRTDVHVTPEDLLSVPHGKITAAGLRGNIRVGVHYLEAWLGGNGCVPLYHLMEDAATAEISRAQIWQWIRHGARLSNGEALTSEMFDKLFEEELEVIAEDVGPDRFASGHFELAARLFSQMTNNEDFDDFLTVAAYEHI